MSESHTTYPVLLLFRSPQAWYSWVLSLLAVLDAAAMHLALSPTTAPSQARLCLRMGFSAFRRMTMTLFLPANPAPGATRYVVQVDPRELSEALLADAD